MSKLSQAELARRKKAEPGDEKDIPGVVKTTSHEKNVAKSALKASKDPKALIDAITLGAKGKTGLRATVSSLEKDDKKKSDKKDDKKEKVKKEQVLGTFADYCEERLAEFATVNPNGLAPQGDMGRVNASMQQNVQSPIPPSMEPFFRSLMSRLQSIPAKQVALFLGALTDSVIQARPEIEPILRSLGAFKVNALKDKFNQNNQPPTGGMN